MFSSPSLVSKTLFLFLMDLAVLDVFDAEMPGGLPEHFVVLLELEPGLCPKLPKITLSTFLPLGLRNLVLN